MYMSAFDSMYLNILSARRLEILRNEFDRLYAQEQEDRHKYDAVQKELK